MAIIKGIKISELNPPNWGEIGEGKKYEFVYIRARKSYLKDDPKFPEYRDYCLANNIPFGCWYEWNPLQNDNTQAQAIIELVAWKAWSFAYGGNMLLPFIVYGMSFYDSLAYHFVIGNYPDIIFEKTDTGARQVWDVGNNEMAMDDTWKLITLAEALSANVEIPPNNETPIPDDPSNPIDPVLSPSDARLLAWAKETHALFGKR